MAVFAAVLAEKLYLAEAIGGFPPLLWAATWLFLTVLTLSVPLPCADGQPVFNQKHHDERVMDKEHRAMFRSVCLGKSAWLHPFALCNLVRG